MQRQIVGTAATANWKCSDQKSGIEHKTMGNTASGNDKCRMQEMKTRNAVINNEKCRTENVEMQQKRWELHCNNKKQEKQRQQLMGNEISPELYDRKLVDCAYLILVDYLAKEILL